MTTRNKDSQPGSVIVSILIMSIFLTMLVYSLFLLANANLTRARSRIMLLQAQYAAESGADAAIAILNSGNVGYMGTTSDITLLTNPQYKATYEVHIAAGADAKEKIITATGKVYAPASSTVPNYSRKIEVETQRSSNHTIAAMSSRNILYVQSGVKNLTAKDIYINNFIWLNKSTTNLIAENITVAGKNTGATNCSIGGTGKLLKPGSFHTVGQTKTNITTAYNNCLTPPGNSSNANFNVAANQTDVPLISSFYLPWSQFMDSSYQNAGNCNDWTTGSFPRNIPSVSGSKKTHYPDSGSGTTTSCALLGDLPLQTGQYNINDNVHVRAHFCLVIACAPTFNNPSSDLRFVFIEGSLNLTSLQTSPGSGPIVFVVYGADPLINGLFSCPYGDAIHLGSSGNTSAPAAYLISMNGLCIDKTKFGSSPALGGLSGKNIYIASNPGTPFDLALDPDFPTQEIPIDATLNAMRYRRL